MGVQTFSVGTKSLELCRERRSGRGEDEPEELLPMMESMKVMDMVPIWMRWISGLRFLQRWKE